MPCDSRARSYADQKRFDDALEQLEKDIAEGRREILTNPFTGEVSITDWEGTAAFREGVCDGCAVARMSQSSNEWVSNSLKAQGLKSGSEFVSAGHNGHPHKIK